MLRFKSIFNKDEKRNSKSRLTKNAHGKIKFLGDYKTLKVLKRSLRTKDNCNEFGVEL